MSHPSKAQEELEITFAHAWSFLDQIGISLTQRIIREIDSCSPDVIIDALIELKRDVISAKAKING